MNKHLLNAAPILLALACCQCVSTALAQPVHGNGIIEGCEGIDEWALTPSGAGTLLWDVHFVDANTGWVVGEGGIVRKTTDGGETWINQNTGAVNRSVFFIDSNTGWVVGDNGLIRKTVDGGATWLNCSISTSQDFWAVFFVDENLGWTGGSNSYLLKTTDGGATWSWQQLTPSVRLNEIHFADANNGWLAANAGIIYRTTDGGVSWTLQQFADAGSMRDIFFLDANTGWAAGGNGLTFRTTDGGDNWQEVWNGRYEIIFGIRFADANIGWTVGDNQVIRKTTDGGITWAAQSSPVVGGDLTNFRGLYVIDQNHAWAAGEAGRIYKTTSCIPEECDDGNLIDGDGCSSCGEIEDGWICEGEPSVCDPMNQPPVCDSGGPYSAPCCGPTTTVQLNGSGSYDPDPEDVLTFAWTTDCPNASFNDDTSEMPALTVDTSTGCSVTCSVTLTVSDGLEESSNTAAVTITPDPPFEIQIDATALSAPHVTIVETGQSLPTSAVQSIELAPGDYRLRYSSGGSPLPMIDFAVTDTGIVDFAVELDAYVSGRGTSTLQVDGFQIQVDLTNLPYTSGNFTSIGTYSGEVPLTLLPGQHKVTFDAGAGIFGSPPAVLYSVADDGTVDYDAALDAYVSGRGTARLEIGGLPVQFDLLNLSYPNASFGRIGDRPTADVITLNLVPGGHKVHFGSGVSPLPTIGFSVDCCPLPGGVAAVDFDADLDGLVDGRGTNMLVVYGYPIDIDPLRMALLDPPQTHFNLLAVENSISTSAVRSFVLVNGNHRIKTTDSSIDFVFEVRRVDGAVDYDRSLDWLLCGRGTDTLVVSHDADADDVPDCADLCPECDDRIDTDGDGVPDDCDPYPDDPHKVYVSNYSSFNISVIDTATNTAVGSPVSVGGSPTGLAIAPNGTQAYAAISDIDSVKVIDTATDEIIQTVTVGDGPGGVAVAPDGSHVYVANGISDTISVIDTQTYSVATVVVGYFPRGVAVTPDGSRVYVANEHPGAASGSVSVIDTAGPMVVSTVTGVGKRPYGLTITPDGTRAYVVNYGTDDVSVIDTDPSSPSYNMVLTTVGVEDQPQAAAVDSDGARVYVTNYASDSVSVIDTAANAVVATVRLEAGSGPVGVAVIPQGVHAYVTNASSNSVSVINTATNTVMSDPVPVGGYPRAVAITPIVWNDPPTAVAGDDQAIHAGQTVHLNGSGSFDDNTTSEDLLYAWTLTVVPQGSSATPVDADTATPSFFADLPGTYIASLVVTDTEGLSSDPDIVEVSSNNLAPTANAGADAGAYVGELVQLDGVDSIDPESDPLTYAWEMAVPEGSAAELDDPNTQTPCFTPDLPGAYTVQLVVNDGFEDSAPDEVVISVITAEEHAENKTVEALNVVAVLPAASVTTQGNQTALGNFQTQAITALQADDIEEAIKKLNQAISRADGCVLRGEPDGKGPGRDWITDCAAQEEVYGLLVDALDAISP